MSEARRQHEMSATAGRCAARLGHSVGGEMSGAAP